MFNIDVVLHKDCKNYFILLNWTFESGDVVTPRVQLLTLRIFGIWICVFLQGFKNCMFEVNMFIQFFYFSHFLIKINVVDNIIQASYLFLCNTNMGEKNYDYLRRKKSNFLTFLLYFPCLLLCLFFVKLIPRNSQGKS